MKLLQFTKKHLPGILTGTGIVLDVSGAVAMGDACVKANRVIEAKTQELDRRLTKEEKLKATWKFFVLPTGLLILAGSCHVGSNVASHKKQLALVGVATASETAYTKLKEQLPEIAGKTKAKKIAEKTVQDMAKESLPEDEAVIEKPVSPEHWGARNTLFFDRWNGRWFWSNTQEIGDVAITLNNLLGDDSNDYQAAMNDMYIELGLKPCDSGDIWRWDKNIMGQQEKLDLYWTAGDGVFTMSDGTEIPYLILRFSHDPTVKWTE